ncbi:MAG TPA: RsmD family RNA methyltransferase [Anaeromyxobacter sp.]|nr:RsmD family RNA methyltransferase [Anaeromyxobacter sp.]
MTRIIAGSARGRRLVAPRGLSTRPTSERVRGAVMNLLGQFFEGGEVLDLYAGTGALALEALSRGCERAVCVERDPRVLEVLRRNAESCGFSERVELLRAELPSGLGRLARGRFLLAFVDPPYAEGPEAVLPALGELLAPGGRAVAEHDVRRPPPDRFGSLALLDRRTYGGTGISIYRRE